MVAAVVEVVAVVGAAVTAEAAVAVKTGQKQ